MPNPNPAAKTTYSVATRSTYPLLSVQEMVMNMAVKRYVDVFREKAES